MHERQKMKSGIWLDLKPFLPKYTSGCIRNGYLSASGVVYCIGGEFTPLSKTAIFEIFAARWLSDWVHWMLGMKTIHDVLDLCDLIVSQYAAEKAFSTSTIKTFGLIAILSALPSKHFPCQQQTASKNFPWFLGRYSYWLLVRSLHIASPFDRCNIPYLHWTLSSQFVAGCSAPHPERYVRSHHIFTLEFAKYLARIGSCKFAVWRLYVNILEYSFWGTCNL